MIDSHEHYRSVSVSHMRQFMRYGPKNYKEDWDSAVSLAQMMAVNGESEHLKLLLDRCFMRIEAYLENNPDAVPWG